LRWLDRYERRPGEEPPIGLILCGEKNQEQIELLQLDRGEIRVAEYLVELPPREMLEASCTRPYGWREGRRKETQELERDARPGVKAGRRDENTRKVSCGFLACAPSGLLRGIDLPPPGVQSPCGTAGPCYESRAMCL